MRIANLSRLMLVVMMATLFGSLAAPARAAQPRAETTDPASAAVFYSRLEAEGRFSELYRYMHPDAQAIIPEAAVVGWYQDHFAPLGPGVITATEVQWLVWTWPVTGESYCHTAEVFYQQPFANGSVVNDVVRLVEHNGEWRWFFGRSREFVAEQLAKYGGSVAESRDAAPVGSCDGATDWWIETYDRLMSAYYLGYTLPNVWAGGTGDPGILREYEQIFARLRVEQEVSPPPSAAQGLHDDFLSMLTLYEFAAGNLAAVASGLDPLAESAVLANGVQALDSAQGMVATLDEQASQFVDAYQPLVVFVPTMGGDIPPAPVKSGENEPEGFMPVECRLFTSQAAAQRFYEAAGPGDPHGLDRDGDGVACEPGE
ncbi:MAG TPA: excalibur calcium-binding domain-containing protein [Thermomicrobiales bacterium]|nr:excalibur calcium-binding domain-containing protein [Thermomicrobiales bacterium]